MKEFLKKYGHVIGHTITFCIIAGMIVYGYYSIDARAKMAYQTGYIHGNDDTSAVFAHMVQTGRYNMSREQTMDFYLCRMDRRLNNTDVNLCSFIE